MNVFWTIAFSRMLLKHISASSFYQNPHWITVRSYYKHSTVIDIDIQVELSSQVKSSSSQVELYCHSTTCVDI